MFLQNRIPIPRHLASIQQSKPGQRPRIRKLARGAAGLSETYLKELIWRDFYQMILWHYPKVGKGQAFKAVYDRIKWRNNEKEFAAWCAGQTGRE